MQRTPEDVANKLIIVIDVNGWQNRPNKLGHDMFAFELTAKGKLAPMGTEDTVYTEDVACSLTSSAPTNGYGCTSKALYDKDYFKKSAQVGNKCYARVDKQKRVHLVHLKQQNKRGLFRPLLFCAWRDSNARPIP